MTQHEPGDAPGPADPREGAGGAAAGGAAEGAPAGPLSVERLGSAVAMGEVDTVLVVFTDVQGRLQGKRVHARYFLDEVLPNGAEGGKYLLAVDVDMTPAEGYARASWELGHGDVLLRPDLGTLRAVPWHPATAMVQCDLVRPDGVTPVAQSPRQVLRAQVEAAADFGLLALAGTELEFMVFDDTYETAWDAGYRKLTPSSRYNVDYSILGTGRLEPLLRDLRNAMYDAGMVVGSAKGECGLGQHEITFQYADVLRTADQHAVYKTAAKEIAAAHGKSLTFMAKYDEGEGNSCHLHMSLRGLDGTIVFDHGDLARGVPPGRTALFNSFVAGVLATLREFTLLYAPNVNSYKRFCGSASGSFAPTRVAWGEDNRTCALRVVGTGPSLRVENRVPGGDANPYLALAAMLAGGLDGVRRGLELDDPFVGDAHQADLPRLPRTLREARDLFAGSAVARGLFGDDVVAHYVNAADVELRAFESAVTDWERVRGFERL